MTIYYVDDATGLDSDDGLSEADAFKTIQKALDTISAGDDIYVKNTNSYAEALTCGTAGSTTGQVLVEGYSSSIGDGGGVY